MRPRTKTEKILLTILVAIIFAGGNFFGYQWLSKKQAALELTALQLQADQAEAKVDLKDTDTWAKRKAWIKDHEPVLGEEGATKAKVLEDVKKGASDNKLEILEQNLSDVQHGPAGARVNVVVKVKGSTEGLVKWLTSLQKPDQFYAISKFSLKVDEDQKSMICTVQLGRYFKEGS